MKLWTLTTNTELQFNPAYAGDLCAYFNKPQGVACLFSLRITASRYLQLRLMETLWLPVVGMLIVSLFGDQVAGLSTIPSTVNGTGVVAAPENTTNVGVYCSVTDSMGNPATTSWRIGSPGPPRALITSSFTNFMITGLLQPNLTIVSFGRALNMVELECTIGFGSNPDMAVFILRIIG